MISNKSDETTFNKQPHTRTPPYLFVQRHDATISNSKINSDDGSDIGRNIDAHGYCHGFSSLLRYPQHQHR